MKKSLLCATALAAAMTLITAPASAATSYWEYEDNSVYGSNTNNTFTSPQVIYMNLGDTGSGYIKRSGDVDVWKFQPKMGSTTYVGRNAKINLSVPPNLNGVLEIWSPDGLTLIQKVDANGAGGAESYTMTMSQNVWYNIKVYGNGTSYDPNFNYTLSVTLL
ncbi:hypothetical protein EV586_10963 [Tumebacillus sp. BK434]|uniref:hypothetical protein n=1 Tax=Tumebacillus sp. BK434 TaxID=2512169 RepID=UPI00104D8068|nr:hypothetical protein [Tumebacillus sp. BK434]TCP52581.1 hypothetical protein EV586_10963 [Tumebacillus sp. BK434]